MIMSFDAAVEGPTVVSAETVEHSKQSRRLFRADDQLNSTLLMFGPSECDASNGKYSLFSIHARCVHTHTHTRIFIHMQHQNASE